MQCIYCNKELELVHGTNYFVCYDHHYIKEVYYQPSKREWEGLSKIRNRAIKKDFRPIKIGLYLLLVCLGILLVLKLIAIVGLI